MQKKKVSILGAGLVGSLLAILLQQRGYQVTIFERRPDLRKNKISAGKSINLAMSLRGWKALETAGLKESIEKIALPMYGRQIHHLDGNESYQPYGKNNEAIYSVSRGDLNKELMTLAEQQGATILFERKIHEVDIDRNIIYMENSSTHLNENFADHDLIISADGAFSSLRNAYTKRDRFNYQQYYIPHGYKELHIPPDASGGFKIEKNALHIWPRKNFMLIALPNIDGSFTCTLFFPFEGNPSFESVKTNQDVQELFETYFKDAIALMPTYQEDFNINPTSSLVTVKCYPWTFEDKSMLIGDAAHAIVPFFGQGMNAGFEDCSVLMTILDQYQDNQWDQILREYEIARKPNGDAVADLALQNFIEMRDLVADPKFLERKKIEKALGLAYPSKFNSVYEMVSFSHTPYSQAIACQHAQNILLEKIMSKGNFDSNIQSESFKLELDQWMDDYFRSISQS